MKSLKLLLLYACLSVTIYANSVKCDEEDSLLQYDGENSMSNADDANKDIYEDIKSKGNVNKLTKSECAPEKKKDQPETAESAPEEHQVKLARTKRSKVRGGVTPIDPESEDFKKVEQLVEDALAEWGTKDENPKYGLHKIKSATKQTVAGTKYKVNADFILPNDEVKDCTITLLVQLWIKPEPTVTDLNCGEVDEVTRRKRSADEETEPRLVGGISPIEPNSDDFKYVQKIVVDALAELATKPDSPKYGLHKIESASKQVVAGALYRVTAKFVLPNNEIKHCKITLLEQLWMQPQATVEDLDCGEKDEVTRKRRSLFYDPRVDVLDSEHEREAVQKFHKFKIEYNRNYESAMEHDMRLRIFKDNLHVIDELNQNEQGTAIYGITEFADFTSHEYKQRTGLLRRHGDNNEISHPMAEIPNIELPKSFDWRDKGVITSVKNQGACGSCWAFSVTGNIEGLHAIKTGTLEEYSEQELVDCDSVDQGCNGGLPDNAYKAIEQIGGLELESEYPYEAKKSKCHFNPKLAHVKVTGAVDLPQNETAMAQYLVANGPLSIGINANAMQFYRGGISHPIRILCRHSKIDHGVLIVGYGVADYPVFNKTLPYWIIKNSWGPSWGEKGYYRVFRGDNTCGVNSMVSSAVLE